MDSKTAAALESSIEHWTRLSEGIANPDEDIYNNDCALCIEFYDCLSRCSGCPVAINGQYCPDSMSIWRKAHIANIDTNKSSPEFLEAAKNMLNFLISLREPNET